jgi:hypothetical protein
LKLLPDELRTSSFTAQALLDKLRKALPVAWRLGYENGLGYTGGKVGLMQAWKSRANTSIEIGSTIRVVAQPVQILALQFLTDKLFDS